MPVSLRIPDDVKRRVERLAADLDSTAHAFMLEAIRGRVEAEEARAEFRAQAEQRLVEMKRAKVGVPAGEVFTWLDAHAAGKKTKTPRPRRLG